jgi:hypothetical protein
LKWPVSASVRSGIFRRIFPCAMSANTCGSRSPPTSAANISRADTVVTLDATALILIEASLNLEDRGSLLVRVANLRRQEAVGDLFGGGGGIVTGTRRQEVRWW